MSLILRNGQTWENQQGERAITQWLGGAAWCLLYLPTEMPGGGTCMLPFLDERKFSVFPAEVLAERLRTTHWRRIPQFGMQLAPEEEDIARREFAASIAEQCALICDSGGFHDKDDVEWAARMIRDKFKA